MANQDQFNELSGKFEGMEYKVNFLADEMKGLRDDVKDITTALARLEERLPKGPTNRAKAFQVSAAGFVASVLVVISEVSGLKDLLDKLTR